MELAPHERLDDLQRKGYRIFQDDRLFCFSVDAVLLADFATVRRGDKVCDLCSGNGIVPLLLCANTEAALIHGVELLEASYSLAQRSVELNQLQDRIVMHCMDLKNAPLHLQKGSMDVVTCNPPFKEAGGGLKNESRELYVARHEAECTLEDIVATGAALLNFRGRFTMVHRPERLCDIICLMRQYGVEVKRLRMVHPAPGKRPTMVLIEGLKGGKPKLITHEPLYVQDEKGQYTEEIHRIYRREE